MLLGFPFPRAPPSDTIHRNPGHLKRYPAMPDGDVTKILDRITGGDSAAFHELLPLVHEELRDIADRHMRGMSPGHTLQTTALVNEVCLKMLGGDGLGWENRAHFLNAASRAMRHVLVDYARRRQSQKRGGGAAREGTDAVARVQAPGGLSFSDLIALGEALEKLAVSYPRKAQVVELRYFGGLAGDDVARILDVTPRTIERDVEFALAWLNREMRGN